MLCEAQYCLRSGYHTIIKMSLSGETQVLLPKFSIKSPMDSQSYRGKKAITCMTQSIKVSSKHAWQNLFLWTLQYTHTYRQVYIYYKYTWQIRRIINLTTFTRPPIRMSHRNRTNYRVKERSKEENHVQLLPIASISSLISRTLSSSCQSCCICTLCSTNSGEVWE